MDRELKLSTNMSERYPKNYYSWLHRLWAIDQINNYDISQRYELLTQETDFLNNWIRHHTSDHCAINHLHQINKRMGILLQFNNLSISNQQQLFNSFNENTKLLNDRPGS
jgi:hypothetical protein